MRHARSCSTTRRRDVPYMPAAKRGSDPAGNRQYADKPAWCLLCEPGVRTLIGYYRLGRLSAACHDHIDRHHPQPNERKNG